jgi:hypothetical protein
MIYWVKIEKMDAHTYIIPSFPNGRRKLFRLNGRLLYIWLLDYFLVKLRLLVEEKLVESLV